MMRLGTRLAAVSAAVFFGFLPAATPTAAASEVSALLGQLKDSSPIKRYEAIESLGELGTPEAIQALINLTADEDNSWLAVRQLVTLRQRAVPLLLESLQDSDSRIVKYAVYALGELKVKEAVTPILGYLSYSDAEMRQNAVFALGNIRDPRSVEPLIAKLRDPDNVVREYAAAALEYLGDQRAVPYLKEALRREEGSIFNMATALYNLGSEDVIDILLDKLKDPAGTNRLYAVYALGKLQDAREVDPLIECLADENVQWLAVKALINVGETAKPSLLRALNRKDRDIRLYSIYALGEIGGQGIAPYLVDKLIDPDFLVRDYSSEALIKIRDRGILPRLLYFLEKGDCSIQSQVLKVLAELGDATVTGRISSLLWCDFAQVQINAAYALGELKDLGSIPDLVKLLGDPNALVSQTAAGALFKIGPPAVGPLLAALPRAKGKSQIQVVYALGKLKAKDAVDPLLQKLADEDPLVRRAVTVALTEIGDARSEERFVMMLSDPDPYVRMYASVGLMQFGGKLSIKLLLNALRSEETSWLAVRILDEIGPRGVDELIAALKDKSIQMFAAQTLIKLDGAILPQLQQGLRSDEELIRNNIALILGEVKDKRAVDALLAAMQDEGRLVPLAATSLINIGDPSAVEPLIQCLLHQNDQVRLYSAYALGHLKDQRAVDPLIQTLKDENAGVRGIAAYSLGLLGARRAIIPLLDALGDLDESVRTSCVYALGKIGDMQSVPFLRERNQKDFSPKVRKAAQEALEQISYRTSP